MTFVWVLVFSGACIWIRLPVFLLAPVLVLWLSLSPFATFDGIGADHAILLPIYFLNQFILGFPDRDRIVLSSPASTAIAIDLTLLTNATGTVSATLKPCGRVQIDGSEYSAVTEDGKLLDSGTPIRVTGVRNSLLIVSASKVAEHTIA